MNILLVGGGGREHALAWRLRTEDPRIQITAAPGNPGIAEHAECVSVSPTDIDALVKLARERRFTFTLVGPEAPLAAGITDRFRAEGLAIFGPSRAAAEIETSKSFSKALMREAKVPTARAMTFTEPQRAKDAARELGAPVVIKASGLAAGKGVIVCETLDAAHQAIDQMLVARTFGSAGTEILVEEFMSGEELSVFGITDGERVIPLVPAQDHKRLREGDEGPNTGGMGAYAPVSLTTDALMSTIADRIFMPTLAGMRAKGRPFTGLLYAGLMLTEDGPKVVEFNCRFGDPETQAVLAVAKLNASFAEVLATVARGERLPDDIRCENAGAAVTTVLASAGYPEHPKTGAFISIPSDLGPGVLVFHAGTTRDADGHLVSAGGRVLAVTGRGASFAAAQQLSRNAAERIDFDGRQYRGDIGWREMKRGARAT